MRRPRTQEEDRSAFRAGCRRADRGRIAGEGPDGVRLDAAPGFLKLDVQPLLAEGDHHFDGCEVFYVLRVEQFCQAQGYRTKPG